MTTDSSVFDVSIGALRGGPADLAQYRGKVLLIVNVASECGFTPQYTGLQKVFDTYADRGLVVIGVPCNQFGEQEPGTNEEIAEFCSVNYGVTFPITEKVEVNGDQRHPLYRLLMPLVDERGHDGDIRWNFEKFVVGRDGHAVARFGTKVLPESPELIVAIEAALAA